MQNPSNALNTLVNPEPVHNTGTGEILKIASQSEKGKRRIDFPLKALIESTFWGGQVLGRLTGTFLRQQLLNGTKP